MCGTRIRTHSPYKAPEALPCVELYLAHIGSFLGAFESVSQAHRYEAFITTAQRSAGALGRMQAWVGRQATVEAP